MRTTIAKAKVIKCPTCKKRVFDIHQSSQGSMMVQLKCPHCKNIVNISVDNKI